LNRAVDGMSKLAAKVGGVPQVNHLTTLKPKHFTSYFMKP
jgi:hypothetical protein